MTNSRSTRSQKSRAFGRAFGSRPLLGLGLVALAACGVIEHPHEIQAVDTSDDFGPIGGSVSTLPPGAAGSTSPTSGGTGAATGGAAGVPSIAGTTSSGGLPGGGVPGVGGAGVGGSPPASGVTINLGGVDVPKEKVIGFIHVGHSNMAGRASRPVSSRAYHMTETHPHAFMYQAGSPPKLALEPTADNAPYAGPGLALLKEAATLAPNHYFVSLGFGQPSAYCSQFLPGSLYYDSLIAAPKAIKGRITFGAIFIYLGITERHGSEQDVTGFPSCINALVTAIRTDVGEPNLPFMMNDYEVEGSGEFAVGGAVASAIMPQITKVPSVVSNSALVSAQGLSMQDNHHFDFDGQRTWAQRAIMTMQQKGWFPWAP